MGLPRVRGEGRRRCKQGVRLHLVSPSRKVWMGLSSVLRCIGGRCCEAGCVLQVLWFGRQRQ
ncbi:hypothetical protein FOA52_000292 [Chlamydomonas sp. UWO 241]|nr:hypothetical protein FOA52_000292 [Chlamydomonas sp. UWO 241]